MSHDIRLAGPWEYSNDGDNWQKFILPFDSNTNTINASRPGLLRRKFHRPTSLGESSVVQVLITASRRVTQIQINEQPVECENTTEIAENSSIYVFDVSAVLNEFNVLTLRVAETPAVRIEGVRLRILQEE